VDLTTLYQTIILGIIEGLTEFLPVSSTGHLLLADELLGFSGPPGKTFEVIIQFGAILSVIVVYWEKLWGVVLRLPTDPQARKFTLGLLIAFLPSMIVGGLLHNVIKELLFNPWIVAFSLIIGGLLIFIIEDAAPRPVERSVDDLKLSTCLKIGLFQLVSMIPGVSRSGATILGGMLIGVERKAAAEFTFFLAIPTMFAASVYDLYKNWAALSLHDGLIIAVGFVVSFLSAYVVVKTFIAFISRFGFAPFAWYRIVVGVAALALLTRVVVI
jgi:undecaprenyl-diphosphatase